VPLQKNDLLLSPGVHTINIAEFPSQVIEIHIHIIFFQTSG
jgi:hypothetical protein